MMIYEFEVEKETIDDVKTRLGGSFFVEELNDLEWRVLYIENGQPHIKHLKKRYKPIKRKKEVSK